MRQVRITLFALISLLAMHTGLAQQTPAKVEVIGRATESTVMLRWAPSRAAAWEFANLYGYTIERYTILRGDSTLVQPPEKTTLRPLVIKPEPAFQWEQAVDEDDYAAIMAQALYGETFELSENY